MDVWTVCAGDSRMAYPGQLSDNRKINSLSASAPQMYSTLTLHLTQNGIKTIQSNKEKICDKVLTNIGVDISSRGFHEGMSDLVKRLISLKPLALYLSQASASPVTTAKLESSFNRIWSGPNTVFIVNDYAISSNTPEGLVLYMQGAKTDGLQRGALLRKGVMVTDVKGILTGQILSNYSAQGGDSGAPIFCMTDISGYVVYISEFTAEEPSGMMVTFIHL